MMAYLKNKLEEEGYFDYNANMVNVVENLRELLGAIYIQEMRNYDMLSIIADKLGADATGLSKLHELGQVLAPAPSIFFENGDEKDES